MKSSRTQATLGIQLHLRPILLSVLVAALWACSSFQVESQGDSGIQEDKPCKAEDPPATKEEAARRDALRKWKSAVTQAVSELGDTSDPQRITNELVEQIERHYADYLDIEDQVLTALQQAREKEAKSGDAENGSGSATDASVYLPRDILTSVGASDDYLAWCKRNELDSSAWIKGVLRLRGYVRATVLRELFDVASLQSQIDAVLDGTVPMLPELAQGYIAERRVLISIAPEILAELDKTSPAWTEAEKEIGDKYASALSGYLLMPRKVPFSKKAVDTQSADNGK